MLRDKLHCLLRGSASGVRPEKRRPMVVERIEPRILHSADPATAFAGGAVLAAQAEHRVLEAQPAPAVASEVTQNERTHLTELVFVDPRTPDYQQLVNDIRAEEAGGRSIEVVVLDSHSDGVAQISARLAGRQGISAIHLISHGSDGVVQFGSSLLDSQTLSGYASALHNWSAALAPGADLLIYGCDVAATAAGRTLVDALSRLTGADVAASENLTGSIKAGGDWNLEYATGRIQTAVAIDAQTEQSWTGTLAISQDAVSSSTTGTTSSTSLSFAHTIGTGADGFLLVELAIKANAGATSVTYGGNALTKLTTVSTGGSTVTSEIWYVKAPTAGTANIVVTMPAAAVFDAGATSYFGVDQSMPLGGVVTATGSGGSPTVTLAAAPGDLVADAVAVHAATTATVGPGQTASWSLNTGSGGGDVWGASSTASGAASVTLSWTTSGSGAGEWASIAVALKPSLNSAPVLTGANDLGAINEDPATNPGTSVSALIGGYVSDANAGAVSGIAVTAVDDTNGSWQYSLDGGGTWTAFGTPNASSARLLAADANTYVRFVPNANFNGTVTNGLTFRAWDQTSGVNGGIADTTSVANTVLDQFNAVSYSNNDGTALWSAGWVDSQDGNPSGGRISVSGGQLVLSAPLGANDSISREANLAGATSAALSFSYTNSLALLGGTVSLQASSGGGYTTLATFSNALNPGSGTFSADISAYISGTTGIQFVVSGGVLGGTLSVDNVQIAYSTPLNGGTTAFSSATASSSIVVTAVNDAPVVTVPAAQTVATNGQLIFSSAGGNPIVVSDVDAGSGSELISLSVTNGTLTLASTAGLTFSTGTGTADASMSFTGTLAAINAAMDGMHFDPAAYFTGSAGLGISVNDQGNTGSGGPLSTTGGVGITVQYNAPGISATGTALNYTENDPATPIDTGLTLTAGTQVNLTGATVQLSANYVSGQDVLAFTNQLGISGSWDAASGKLTLTGSATVADYQTALRSVTYSNTSDNPSTANRTATFSIDDGVGTQTSSRQIAVAAVNDAPVVSAPAFATVTEDVASALTGVSFSDVDAGSASVLATFSVAQGSLSAVSSGGVTVGGSATALTLSGSIANINLFIAASNLTYTTAPNDTSAVTLGVSIDDLGNSGAGGAFTAAASVTLNVTPVNDAPMGTNNTVSTAEDTPYVFATVDFGFSDPNDTPPDALLAVKITSLPGAGTLSLSGSAVSAGQFIPASDITLGKLVFTPAPNANGSGYASFTFQVQDNGGVANGGIDLDSVARTLAIDVTAVNDAPVISVPAAQTVPTNGQLVFSSAGANAVVISDVDAASGAEIVSLSVTSGTLTLASTTGLTFSTGTGTADASMSFTGTLVAINGAVDGMRFDPATGFNGAAALAITVNDQGNTGAGGAGNANATVAIVVSAPVSTGLPSVGVPSTPVAPSVPGAPLESPVVSAPTAPTASVPVVIPAAPDSGPATSAHEAATQSPSRTEEPSPADSAPDARAGQRALQGAQSEQPRTAVRVASPAFSGRDLRLLLATTETPELALANFALTNRDSPYANQIALASLRSTELLNELDRLRDGLQEQSKGEAHAIALTTAATLGLSVGYVFWLLRGGVFLSTVLSSMPAWRMIDPLPILGRLEDDADDEGDPDESLESLVARKNRSAGGTPQQATS